MTSIDLDAAWAAFDARDRSADGRFVVAVRTTRIYCKPSCPARRPRRENVEMLADGAAARAAGYRACLRCRPDEAGRDSVAVARAVALIEAAEEVVPLAELAAQVGYAPHHFQRVFTRALGVSPAAYARGLRAKRAETALDEEASVTDAIYEAGYSGPSRFYEGVGSRLGMTPGVRRKGAEGVAIRWTVTPTSLGPLLVAATDKGLCRVAFEDGPDELARRFPGADISSDEGGLAQLVAEVVDMVERPGRDAALPLDVRGTAFQEAVWAALKAIPPGETRTYAELAAAAGNPSAVRAAGTACGANQLAVVIPCHRALRTGGGLGGYAYGLERKRALLDRERRG
ncbi:bifunctional transcriptional activator/DNA repair enzyme AdaA [Sphingomonas lenta]|uniref:methylated-DNA--[protein]-cysteine S-methyltransferase n=1 Tax=Sphingomonas lenta TaxID=1141887 RepID=A0A2A2SIF7_9SPHN|nr:methylated-DNA--[protein]-cysteine S-methyltransferase [Sphingomonas lenta]PAX08801.1 bifunctional transcriptional activator/DNA repair enzyme protein Ada [Sphingomonas lenta]